MRRRISLLLATVLAGTTMLFGPTQPASAAVVCAIGNGTVTVTPGILYPVLLGLGAAAGKDHLIDIKIGDQGNALHAFTLGVSVGGCVHVDASPTLAPGAANGSLLGFCGHSTGTGTINGETFAYVSAGTFLVLTGGAVGLASAVPTPLTGSCGHVATGAPLPPTTTFGLPGGATQFIVSGAGLGLNCGGTTGVSQLVTVPTLTLPDPAFGIHTGTLAHATVRVCTAPNPVL